MQPPSDVTWIKVDAPSFDLVGVLFSSLSLTGMLAVLAALLGAGFGMLLIRRRRAPHGQERSELSLHGRQPRAESARPAHHNASR